MAVSVREERDPAFWERVIEHPAVRHVLGDGDVPIALIIGSDRVLPLASAHGGVIFAQLDGLGRVHEMHRMFEPEGRGGEACMALGQALLILFQRGADLVVTYETPHPQSRKPLSFGFRCVGEWADSAIGPVRTWILTRQAWEQSPARRRACLSQH